MFYLTTYLLHAGSRGLGYLLLTESTLSDRSRLRRLRQPLTKTTFMAACLLHGLAGRGHVHGGFLGWVLVGGHAVAMLSQVKFYNEHELAGCPPSSEASGASWACRRLWSSRSDAPGEGRNASNLQQEIPRCMPSSTACRRTPTSCYSVAPGQGQTTNLHKRDSWLHAFVPSGMSTRLDA